MLVIHFKLLLLTPGPSLKRSKGIIALTEKLFAALGKCQNSLYANMYALFTNDSYHLSVNIFEWLKNGSNVMIKTELILLGTNRVHKATQICPSLHMRRQKFFYFDFGWGTHTFSSLPPKFYYLSYFIFWYRIWNCSLCSATLAEFKVYWKFDFKFGRFILKCVAINIHLKTLKWVYSEFHNYKVGWIFLQKERSAIFFWH